jgi:hypothetical protein
MALGLMPKLGALVAVMPPALLGGATVVLFGLVAMAGVRIVAQGGFSGRTMLTQLPEAWHPILGSPLIVGTMTAPSS